MRIGFLIPPSTAWGVCHSSAEKQLNLGHRLKPKYVRPGRPGIIKNILVVDDKPGVLKMVKLWLGSLKGLEKIILVNPDASKSIKEQVLDFVLKEKIDFIIMDGSMETEKSDEILEGKDLIKILREKGFQGYIIANSGMPSKQKEMLAAGADFENPEKALSKIVNFFEA